jgi:hypothetical protein
MTGSPLDIGLQPFQAFDIHGKSGVNVEQDIALRQGGEMPMDDIRLPGPETIAAPRVSSHEIAAGGPIVPA